MKIFALCAGLLVLLGCEQRLDSITNPANPRAAGVKALWKPCVVAHSPGGIIQEVQFREILNLKDAQQLEWLRLDAHMDGIDVPYFQFAQNHNFKTLAIINMRDLESSDSWESTFETVYRQYHDPTCHNTDDNPCELYEIAGEISNDNPFVNPQGPRTPEYYVPHLRALYDYVGERHPEVILTSAPTLGAKGGPSELRRFIELGMLDMPRLVIAVNVYTDYSFFAYVKVFDEHAAELARHKIWVTETGKADPAQQIAWIQTMYPQFTSALRAEMTCYYVLYGGEGPPDNGFGLISGIENPPLVRSPLLKALTEKVQ